MSGLFTRLARQAVGQPHNPVRAAVSLAHQPAPDTFPAQSGSLASDLATDIIDHNSRPDLDGSLSSSQAAQPTLSADVNSTTLASPGKTLGRSTRPGIETIETDRLAVTVPSDNGGEPVSQRLTAPVLPLVTDTDVLEQPESADTQLPSSVRSSDEIVTTPRHGPPLVVESNQNKQPSRQVSSPTEPIAPEPLLPSVSNPASTSSAAPAQISSTAAESPNEVHVHIGRIEVTALQADAAPKPKPRAARQPMSLDDYLARRRQN